MILIDYSENYIKFRPAGYYGGLKNDGPYEIVKNISDVYEIYSIYSEFYPAYQSQRDYAGGALCNLRNEKVKKTLFAKQKLYEAAKAEYSAYYIQQENKLAFKLYNKADYRELDNFKVNYIIRQIEKMPTTKRLYDKMQRANESWTKYHEALVWLEFRRGIRA